MTWENAEESRRLGYRDFIGRPVLTIVGGIRRNVPTQYQTTDVIHVTLVSLVGPDAGSIYNDVHVYSGKIVDSLRVEQPGAVKLSKVVEDGKAVKLVNHEYWDAQAADAWLAANPGILERLKVQAAKDFADFLAKPQDQQRRNDPMSSQYQQQYAPPQYQTAPQYVGTPQGNPPQQYAPQQQAPQGQPAFVPPGPEHAQSLYPQQQAPAQPDYYRGIAEPTPQQYVQQQGVPQYQPTPLPASPPPSANDGPPAQPPPSTYAPTPNPNYAGAAAQPQPNGGATLASMQSGGTPPATPQEAGY